MSTSRNRILLSIGLGLVLIELHSVAVRAQGLGNSPYSSQGIGELYNNNNITNIGMGGIGVAYANRFFLNTANPALLARNRFTLFEVGVLGQVKQLADGRQSQQDFGANLNYLALAFPVNSRWSMALGLRPYSYVDYQTTLYGKVPGTIYEAEYSYRGRGGLNRATFTNGWQLWKNIYVGVEAAFLFGNITNDSESRLIINNVDDLTVSRSIFASYSDISWKLGAAWRPKVGKDWFLNIGTSWDPQTNIRGRETDTYQQLLNGQEVSTPDTLRNNHSGSLHLPSLFRVGIAVEKLLNFSAGVELMYQPWSQFSNLNGLAGSLRDSYSLAAGVEYAPKANSTRYIDLIIYRAGFNYSRLPYSVNATQPNDMSVSLGFSLPVGQNVNSVNLSFALGKRGSLVDTQIRERYVKMALGLSLNDIWFRRYKVD